MQNKKHIKTMLSVTVVLFSILFFIAACNMNYRDNPAETQNLIKVPDTPFQVPDPGVATLETEEAKVQPPETEQIADDLIPETTSSINEPEGVDFRQKRVYASLIHEVETVPMVAAPEPEFYFILLLGCLVLMISLKQRGRIHGGHHG